ncbi:MAG: CCA-adding enzyme [Methanoregula sp. PtaU1.Bin051]|nr:MAG: CCA-adding enzyme [Methanoregula sp. PtaU1.Bin051]
MRPVVEQEILALIRPTDTERQQIKKVAEKLVQAVDATGSARGMVVGSIARDTWIAGEHDIDIFLLFPPSLSREELEKRGLSLARRIAAQFSDRFYEKYAEHPYIYAKVDGYDIDLVPCFDVKSAAAIQSAVDRTPFHTRYIIDKINGLIDDVLLLKQFARAGGIYGSDQMTEGFSGYLCELLVLHYGGFAPLLEAASSWRPGVVIDPERHAAKQFDEPLVVIDPVDPKRNVAAAVSLTRMMGFVELARGYRDVPSASFFTIADQAPISHRELSALLEKRRTYLYAITFATPPIIPEILVPQLKRSVAVIAELLERHGFPVHNARYEPGESRCIFLFELLLNKLPAIRIHAGPPLWNRENADKFFEKYAGGQSGGLPFISAGKYAVEVQREYPDAKTLLSPESILGTSLGKHVRKSLEKGFSVSEGADCYDPEFAAFIGRFFDRSSPLARIKRK